MTTSAQTALNLQVRDASGQREASPDDVAGDATVAEFVERMVKQMRLAPLDHEGRPLIYQALHQREGRHLHGSERVGEAVESGDVVVLHPNIDAGGAG
jgi:hypothetical protein